MSLVGNFTTNNDRAEKADGPGLTSALGRNEHDIKKQEIHDQLSPHESREHIPDPSGDDKLHGQTANSSSTNASERDAQVRELARQYTKQSSYSNVEGNPFDASDDSTVNPRSDNFKARAWVTSLLKLVEHDENSITRQAGIAFRSLGAHGFGAATDYQKSVGNAPAGAYGYIRRLMGAKQRRIDIFSGFDGLVHAGEM